MFTDPLNIEKYTVCLEILRSNANVLGNRAHANNLPWPTDLTSAVKTKPIQHLFWNSPSKQSDLNQYKQKKQNQSIIRPEL